MTRRFLCRFIAHMSLLIGAIGFVRGEQPPLHSHRTFKIGVLVSLTGSWNSLGQDTVAALQMATDQLDDAAKANQRRLSIPIIGSRYATRSDESSRGDKGPRETRRSN